MTDCLMHVFRMLVVKLILFCLLVVKLILFRLTSHTQLGEFRMHQEYEFACVVSYHTQLTGGLKEFRMSCPAARAAANRLVLPDAMRMLPLWVLGMLKSAALRGGAKVCVFVRVCVCVCEVGCCSGQGDSGERCVLFPNTTKQDSRRTSHTLDGCFC